MTNPITLTLDRHELCSIALATQIAAGEAYDDERLHIAAHHHRLAARLWVAAGAHKNALGQSVRADEITDELIAIAAGTEETV
jgi:hypothetical protein